MMWFLLPYRASLTAQEFVMADEMHLVATEEVEHVAKLTWCTVINGQFSSVAECLNDEKKK